AYGANVAGRGRGSARRLEPRAMEKFSNLAIAGSRPPATLAQALHRDRARLDRLRCLPVAAIPLVFLWVKRSGSGPSKPSRTQPDGSGYMRRYSSGSLTTGGFSFWFSSSLSFLSSSSSLLGSRCGGQFFTRVLLIHQVVNFFGLPLSLSAT